MKIKKLLALVLTLCIVIGAVPSAVFALDDSSLGEPAAALKSPVSLSDELGLVISPQVEDPSFMKAANTVTDEQRYKIAETAQTLSVADLGLDAYPLSGDRGDAAFSDLDEAAASLRAAMVQRTTERISVPVYMDTYDSDQANNILAYIFNMAFVHTGVGNEGDYLLWHWATYQIGLGYSSGVLYCYYTFTYYTDAQQEAYMNEQVPAVMESLALEGKTDYGKFSAIYEYITHNITYDYANLNDDSYTLKYSAYAALANGTAVCQGYANLLYRMLLSCGIDCRLIAGIGGSGDNSGPHAWNIVRLGNLYYNVDSTWDAGGVDYYINGEYDHTEYPYDYMLKCNANFPSHLRNEEYETEEFNTVYPMADRDFDPLVDDKDYTAAVAASDGRVTFFETLGEAVDSAATGDVAVLRHDAAGEGFSVGAGKSSVIYLAESTYTVNSGDISVPSSSTLLIVEGTVSFAAGSPGNALVSSGTLEMEDAVISGTVIYSGGTVTIDGSSVTEISIASGYTGAVSVSKSRDSVVTSIPDGYEWHDNGERDVLRKVYTGTMSVSDHTKGKASYSVDGDTVTVTCATPCRVGYYDDSTNRYVAITAVKEAETQNTYSFTPDVDGVTEVIIDLKGDVNQDGVIGGPDALLIRRIALRKHAPTALEQFASDVNGDNLVNGPDALLTQRVALRKSSFTW